MTRCAASERLHDLVEVATKLQAVLDAEGRDLLPGMLVARTAVAADKAANELAGLLETLTASGAG